jgi:hypothetical protein
MNRITEDELAYSLKQCGFSCYDDYVKFRNETIAEAERSITKNKKNIFQKIGNWLNVLFSNSKESN